MSIEQQLLDVLTQLAEQQAAAAQQQAAQGLVLSRISDALLKNTEQLKLLTEALAKPSQSVGIEATLEKLLAPLVSSLNALTARLPPPPR